MDVIRRSLHDIEVSTAELDDYSVEKLARLFRWLGRDVIFPDSVRLFYLDLAGELFSTLNYRTGLVWQMDDQMRNPPDDEPVRGWQPPVESGLGWP